MSITIYESVKKCLSFIEANLQNNIGVLDVANSVSYSQFYFSRQFAKHTHISIYDYILKRKISESYKTLFQSDMKIIDLAYQYGFQSHEVFTRAFHKVFKENPSDAAVYKPLAIYEKIDEHYLAFLHGLEVEMLDQSMDGGFFETESLAEWDSGNNYLVLLSKEHLLSCNHVFQGNLDQDKNKFLSFKLGSLKHKIRIYHSDAKFSFRYFIDNIYDVNEMGSNYIFIKKEKKFIDIMIPL